MQVLPDFAKPYAPQFDDGKGKSNHQEDAQEDRCISQLIHVHQKKVV